MGRPPLQRLGAGAATATSMPPPTRMQRFYVGEPEAWILVLEHRLTSGIGVWSGQDLPGFLREVQLPGTYSSPIEYAAQGAAMRPAVTFGLPASSKGAAVRPAATFGLSASSDRRLQVRIGDLLAAAGVHLDQECTRCPEFNITGEKAMLRNVGVELEITLFYTNLWLSWQDPTTWLFPAKEPSFELKVAARQPIEGVRTLRSIPAAQSYFDLEDAQKESARVTRRSHGIRLLFRQQGVLGTWDSMALAYFLLQSCTFLGVAWTLTELLCSMAPLLCGALRWPTPAWYDCLQPATDVPTQPKKKMQ